MVADLLDMSRLQTGAVEPLLRHVGARRGGRRRVVRGLDARPACGSTPACPTSVADAGLLERVLANLVGNALPHTDGPVRSPAPRAGTRARLRVVDHGPGCRPSASAMFEPFQRLGDAAAATASASAWPSPAG